MQVSQKKTTFNLHLKIASYKNKNPLDLLNYKPYDARLIFLVVRFLVPHENYFRIIS